MIALRLSVVLNKENVIPFSIISSNSDVQVSVYNADDGVMDSWVVFQASDVQLEESIEFICQKMLEKAGLKNNKAAIRRIIRIPKTWKFVSRY